jgi:HAE1 family hydrophobic/amphiphilic exporter-1
VAIAIILAAVFVPTVFIPGITGRLYQQFAVTIAISVMISAFNALSLSPALAALLLKPRTKRRGPLGWFFGWFNRIFARASKGYIDFSSVLIRKAAFSLVFLAVVAVAAVAAGRHLPASFLPEEDQGYFMAALQLPDGASLQRTSEAARNIEKLMLNTPGVEGCMTVVGFNLLSGVANTSRSSSCRSNRGTSGPSPRRNTTPSAGTSQRGFRKSARASPSPSRRPPFPASGPSAASRSCSKTIPARTRSS